MQRRMRQHYTDAVSLCRASSFFRHPLPKSVLAARRKLLGGLVVPYTIFTMIRHFQHGHDEHVRPAYPYIMKRDKPMPWALAGGTDCGLFDYKCSAAIAAAKEE